METWSTHQLYKHAAAALGPSAAGSLRLYAQKLTGQGVAVVFTLGHLARISGVDYHALRQTVNRRRESANYRMYAVKKRSGGRRFIHSVCADLLKVQRFINQEILQKRRPHHCSFAFHDSGGIRKCAAMHCGARWLFQLDLTDFFYSVNEIDAYRVFRDIGYRQVLAFELARICTTTHLPRSQVRRLYLEQSVYFNKYARSCRAGSDDDSGTMPYPPRFGVAGVLPQGAPTSPMLSNLAALNLDTSLNAFALENGFVYTRYADDITLSATNLPRSVGSIYTSIIHIIRRSGFKENIKKTRIAGPGSKKVVLGLLVDGKDPRISKETYRRIDRHLYASLKYGLVDTASHEGFDSAFGFHNHLAGLVAFVKDVDQKRWQDFSSRLKQISTPWVET